jgi:hypothetical protein
VQTLIRDTLVSLVYSDFLDAFPGVPLVTDNAPFDWNSPPEKFVEFEVRNYGGMQIGASATPRTRYRGYAYITAYCRIGLGSRPALELLDWFNAALAYKTAAVPGLRLHLEEPDPAGSQSLKGWYTEQLKVSFYADPV